MNARIQLKIDTEANWLENASTFIPRSGEMVIYSPDEAHSVPRLKVGNGTDYLENLPFTTDELLMKNGTKAYWTVNKNYVPKKGEIIVITSTGNSQLKVGDGTATVENLAVYGGGDARNLVDENGDFLSVGSSYNPVYFEDGVPVASEYNIWKTVPANAVFTDTTYEVATASANGLLSADDKKTIDSLKENAVVKNAYTSASNYGIVKIGDNIDVANGVISVKEATTENSGLMTAVEKTKLSGIETGAQKNVQADWNAFMGDAAILNKPTLLSTALIGQASGIAGLDESGKVPASQLPSYVDDVLEFDGIFPTTGETGKIYVDTATNKSYRWSGSSYVEISASLALGTTASTAFAGDRGQRAYEHAGAASTMTSDTATGLYKVGINKEGHITSAVAISKDDITDLGVPAQDTTYDVFNGSNEGLVPSSNGENNKYLAADGSWHAIDIETSTVDSTLSATSINAVQNKVVKAALDNKQDAGDYITANDSKLTTAYNHATSGGVAKTSGLYKITTNDQGHITAATAVSKSDITALGIPAQDTQYSLSIASNSVLGGIKTNYSASGNYYAVKTDSSGNAYVYVPTSSQSIPEATTSQKGIVYITDNLSTSYTAAQGYAISSSAVTTLVDSIYQSINARSTVSFTRSQTTGTKIGTITINNVSTDLYAPSGSTYTLSAANSTTLGGVKIGYAENGKNYPVELDSNSKMYVNVPWTDTTYTLSSTDIISALSYTPAKSTHNHDDTYAPKGNYALATSVPAVSSGTSFTSPSGKNGDIFIVY